MLAGTDGLVARRIYAGEVDSAEVTADRRQVEGFQPLLAALAGGERAAVRAAVESLVFSHTHVVRLRVSDRSGAVAADVGGPYILAPVSGSLRYRGRTVGRYTLSVQDDLGYVKLVTRFLGVPLVIRAGAGSLPVEGLLDPAPPRIPAHGPVGYHGRRYQAFSFSARAFPAGPLRISLLVPLSGAGSTRACATVRTAELGRIAARISRRFALSPSTLPAYLKVTRTLTGALVYVRSGSSTVAGSTLPTPPRLPPSGSVSYRGRRYQVASFTAPSSLGALHVYVLAR